jgi:uncharacterized DUF497 family protein
LPDVIYPHEFPKTQKKATVNARKNRVTFGEAETTFADERSLDIYDPDHSVSENRFVKLGMSAAGRLLVVVYAERMKWIRIISARSASRIERTRYENPR